MMPDYPRPPIASQKQPVPRTTDAMQPRPDHGEKTCNDSFSVMAGLRPSHARFLLKYR